MAPAGIGPRKQTLWRAAEALAPRNDRLNARNRYFHDEDARYLRFLIGPGQRIPELGCGAGNLLAALEPSLGVGVDFSPAMIALAKKCHLDLTFQVADVEDPALFEKLGASQFDIILMSDIVGSLDDAQRSFARLTGPVFSAHLWPDADIPLPPWLDAVEDGAGRLVEIQGDLT